VTLILFTLLLGAGGTVGGLWVAGVPLPFVTRAPDYRGLVPVPVTATQIPAYSRVTRDYLLEPGTGRPRYIHLPPETVEKLHVISDFGQITGRVVNHDKPPNYPFTEDDFLPKGTRPGIVAGIPSGKRAITVDVGKIQGIHVLKSGDHLDLLASVPINMEKVLSKESSSLGTNAVDVGVLSQMKQATVRVIVQNGVLISPVQTRSIPVSSNTLMQGAVTRTRPVQEAIIAVDPAEIASLTEAIATDAAITCVARSGLPDDPGRESVTPDGSNPADQVTAVERIVGGKRDILLVPKSPAPKQELTAPDRPDAKRASPANGRRDAEPSETPRESGGSSETKKPQSDPDSR
jgi:Flp pilus assembly protein CpaB